MDKRDRCPERGFSRRELLKRVTVIGAATAASESLLPAPVEAAPSQQTETLQAVQALSAREFETLSAITGRIIPTDETGPGAIEAHAATYIDRALNSHYSYQKDTYSANLAVLEAYSTATHGSRFAALPPDKQDAVLTALERNEPTSFGFTPAPAAFFNMVLGHTQEGMFSDPYYGGNANFIGWDLLGFPGVKLEYTAAEQQLDYPIVKARRSAYSYSMFDERKR